MGRHDVTKSFQCEVDQIYNLACPASPVHYQYNAIKVSVVRSLIGVDALVRVACIRFE